MTATLDNAQGRPPGTGRPGVLYQTVIRLGGRPLRDARAIHRQVEYHTRPQRTLWAQPSPRTLVLRSVIPAAWSDWPDARSVHTREHSPLHPVGEVLHFSLIANATRAIHSGADSNGAPIGSGRRVSIEDSGQAIQWLGKKLAGALDLHQVECTRMSPVRGGRNLTLSRWAYSGTADVTDPDRLAELLTHGVGRGKAFGCGLLLVGGEPRA